MDWLKNELSENEEVIYQTRPHRYIFITPLFIMLWGYFDLWFLLIGIIYMVGAVGRYMYLTYVITNQRIIIKKGFFHIRTEEIMLHDVEDVIIRRSLSDKIIRGGTLFIFGSAISTKKLTGLGNPATFRSALYSQLPTTTYGYFENA